ncbi:condensation domain-containing protein [Streptomyces sp. GC420]|uniref:condensation domain-containing protein n=1 Tax=Streptomyces sp. GC420 TaxID=2697568 RepID=UPI002442743A|nr:condensation domain-containing protein [Streptomyces sp. GC420]
MEAPVWYPATRTQQGLWVLDRDESLRPTQLVPTVVEFAGPVDHALLVAATTRALGRHPSLRARFRLDIKRRRVEYSTHGEPARAGFLDAAAEGWSEEETGRLVRALCATPFDLATEAPARAEIIRTGEERTLLVLTSHHIVVDGLSRTMLLEEIFTIYRAGLDGTEPELSDPPHPASVVATRSEEEVAAQVEEVVERLRGAPTDVRLPFERAQDEPSHLGTGVTTHLDAERTAKALAVAAEEGCTTFMLGIALLAGALARGSDQRDFLIAFAWPGREHPDAGDVIGMFVTTVVLRVSLGEDTTWRELLRDARIAGMEAFMDSDAPLDAIAARLNPDRNALWPPLTPVLLNLDDAPHTPWLAPGVTGRLLPLDPLYIKYDLAAFVRVADSAEGRRLELSLDHPLDVTDHRAVSAFLTDLRRCAADLATSPEEPVLEQSVDAINLDDPAERLELVRSIWCEVLQTDEVDDDVSFFESGGDSLLLVVLVEKLSQASGRALRTVDLFRSATVSGQAELLAAPATEQPGPAPAGSAALDAARNRRPAEEAV